MHEDPQAADDQLDAADATEHESWLTIAEAARISGCSVDTVRRRIKRGLIEYRLVETLHGPTYQVRLGTASTVGKGIGAAPGHAANGRATPGNTPMQPQESPALVELIHLVGRLQEENRNLAGQLGFVQAQLEQANETIKALQAPKAGPERSEAPRQPTRHPWWRFWKAARHRSRAPR